MNKPKINIPLLAILVCGYSWLPSFGLAQAAPKLAEKEQKFTSSSGVPYRVVMRKRERLTSGDSIMMSEFAVFPASTDGKRIACVQYSTYPLEVLDVAEKDGIAAVLWRSDARELDGLAAEDPGIHLYKHGWDLWVKDPDAYMKGTEWHCFPGPPRGEDADYRLVARHFFVLDNPSKPVAARLLSPTTMAARFDPKEGAAETRFDISIGNIKREGEAWLNREGYFPSQLLPMVFTAGEANAFMEYSIANEAVALVESSGDGYPGMIEHGFSGDFDAMGKFFRPFAKDEDQLARFIVKMRDVQRAGEQFKKDQERQRKEWLGGREERERLWRESNARRQAELDKDLAEYMAARNAKVEQRRLETLKKREAEKMKKQQAEEAE